MATPLIDAPASSVIDAVDQHVVLHGVSWATYEALLSTRGEGSVPRLTYLNGELELMSPSRYHERLKTLIARLVEAYADERGLDLNGFGSWTIKQESKERGLEADECYILGEAGDRTEPDLAIEVEWTRGILDKLAVYSGLEVGEVWVWRKGRIHVYLLAGLGYEQVERSRLLPELDLQLLVSFLDRASQSQAVREFRAAILIDGRFDRDSDRAAVQFAGDCG